MPTYAIDGDRSAVTVVARSSVHDTRTRLSGVGGSIDADPTTLSAGEASVSLTVDMTTADAGDWLKNRKLRKDLQLSDHPTARFSLSRLFDVSRDGERFRAAAAGTLSWRGRDVEINARGEGTVTDNRIDAVATFELDIRDLGVVPPKILMFKVEDVVEVEATISARVPGLS